MGPSALRVAGLEAKLEALGHKVTDRGNVHVPVAETKRRGDARARFLKEIAECDQEIAERVEQALARKATPIVLGGDHSVAAGTVAGVANHFRALGQAVGLIWIDAHSDINTPETSTSGNVHGMPLAAVLGMGPAELTNLLGWRSTRFWWGFAMWMKRSGRTSGAPGLPRTPCGTSTSWACAR